MAMHEGQLELDAVTVAALIKDQFPSWAALPVRVVNSHGTVNLLFRLGEELLLRFGMENPGIIASRDVLAAEVRAAHRLRGRVPCATPEFVAWGEPGRGYPLPWAVYRWLPGVIASDCTAASSEQIAHDVALFVAAVRSMDTDGRTFSGTGRGGVLSTHDSYVEIGLGRSGDLIDTTALGELWDRLRSTPRDDVPDRWTHGDLMPGNLLIAGGRLAAVIDVGGLGPADPALDLQPAWNLFEPGPRDAFRAALDVGEQEWDRGKGWALAQAIGCLWYYRDSNPVMSQTALVTLEALLTDHAADRTPRVVPKPIA